MLRGPFGQFPVASLIVGSVLVFLFLFLIFFVIPVGIVTEAFARLGLSPVQGILVLLAMIIGSKFNLTVHVSDRLVRVAAFSSVQFRGNMLWFARREMNDTGEDLLKKQEIAVNVGGCVIPCLMAAFILWKGWGDEGLLPWCVMAAGVVGAACYAFAKPRPGVGLTIPILLPPLLTAMSVWLLVPHELAPQVAYVGGCVGTLAGADVAHLFSKRTRDRLDAAVLSIGGAGTFGAVFLTGILAVLVA